MFPVESVVDKPKKKGGSMPLFMMIAQTAKRLSENGIFPTASKVLKNNEIKPAKRGKRFLY